MDGYGAFTLTNTNRLVRFYPGATGLKTGSTSKAGYCLSATACRNGMHLIAVVMGAPTRDIRNEEAKKLLDFGFAQFAVYRAEENAQSERAVVGGTQDTCRLLFSAAAFVVPKGKEKDVVSVVTLPDSLSAPLVRGQQVGETVYTLDGEEVGRAPISAAETVDVISFWTLFLRIVKKGVGSSF